MFVSEHLQKCSQLQSAAKSKVFDRKMSTIVQFFQSIRSRSRFLGTVGFVAWAGLLLLPHTVRAQAVSMPEGEGGVLFASQKGGTDGAGVIYRRVADGTLTTLYSFDVNTASEPAGSLTREVGGMYFGATAYGTRTVTESSGDNSIPTITYDPGVIFSVSAEPGSFRELRRMVAADGQRPVGNLLVLPLTLNNSPDGSLLLGVAAGGGANGAGTIFKMRSDGTEFSVVHSFPSGSVPSGGLELS